MSAVGLPGDSTLPFFAYGLFKPGEPLYPHIQHLVDGSPSPGRIGGSLRVRDGVPLLKPGAEGAVKGYVIRFAAGQSERGYGEIGAREPGAQYRWQPLALFDAPELLVNTLVGRSPDKGSVESEGNEWRSGDDTVLRDGLNFVDKVAAEHAVTPFHSAPPGSFDWERLFRLQMAYLFLWTVIERYAALAYSPELGPEEKVTAFGEDSRFKELLARNVHREHRLLDTRDPGKAYRLDSTDARQSAKYYFQVRNNLTHRGKGAWQDAETVRQSFQELRTIVRQMVGATPGLSPDPSTR